MAGDGLGLGEARKIATALDLDDLTEKQGTMNSLGLKWTLAVFFRILTFSLIEISDLSKQRDS